MLNDLIKPFFTDILISRIHITDIVSGMSVSSIRKGARSITDRRVLDEVLISHNRTVAVDQFTDPSHILTKGHTICG